MEEEEIIVDLDEQELQSLLAIAARLDMTPSEALAVVLADGLDIYMGEKAVVAQARSILKL